MEENFKQQQSIIVKLVLVGPESHLKTKLTKQLANHFNTVFAADFAIDYLKKKWKDSEQIGQPEDVLPIAIGQTKLENEALLTANQFLFCDSCLIVNKVFSEINFNFCDPALDKAARKHKYDLFFLFDGLDNTVVDSLESVSVSRLQKVLEANNKPYIILNSNLDTAFKQAIECIENLVKAKEIGFNSHDVVQIVSKGIQIEIIKKHIALFKQGISKAILVKPTTKNDGIIVLSDQQYKDYAQYFDSKKNELKLTKFVPASGAASRMFKFLNEFLNEFDLETDTINSYINKKNSIQLTVFFAGLEKFPFFETIYTILKELNTDFNSWSSDKKKHHFIHLLLHTDYFNFSNKPKAILPFHKYETHTATPIEEHLMESALYTNSNGIANLHFTISKIHKSQFEKIIEQEIQKVEHQTNTKIELEFSFQNSATDTIAVDYDNLPFRNSNGELVFRPAGHGALIDNLNQINADIIFIKNIDNVIQNHVEEITLYKKALAGKLIQLQEQVFKILHQINNQELSEVECDEIIVFAQNKLNISIIEEFSKFTLKNKIDYIKDILNRPIRVCGMVRNEGEPGGGPFWVQDKKGYVSLQIVETAQIDLQNSHQAELVSNATHFNPVDLVCAVKDYKKQKFDLNQFVDTNSGFIVEKNKNGKNIKAYELPGLWNGAMAKWITIFVEVPLITFNPVKTVNDLLKPAHQPE